MPVGYDPTSAAFDSANGLVYVVNVGSANVSVINGSRVVGSISVGSGPVAATFDAGHGYVYVADSYSNNVSVIRGMSLIATLTVGSGPGSAVFDGGNGYVYVTNNYSDNVSVINGTKIVGTVHVGSNPISAAYDSRNGYVYVVNINSHNVSVIHGTALVATVPVGTEPERATIDPGNGFVYVANAGSSNVSVINGTKVIASVVTGSGSGFGAYDSSNGYVYIANGDSGNVTVIDGTVVVGSIPVGSAPSYATYVAENGNLYVVNAGNDSLTVITGTSVAGWIPVGVGPVYAVFDSANENLDVMNSRGSTVSVIFCGYKVAFHEYGLPAGTVWLVNLSGSVLWTLAPADLTFVEPNGTYTFTAGSQGYAATPLSNTLTIYGANQTVQVRFGETFSVLFHEKGLAPGTSWSVDLNGTLYVASSATLAFTEVNGTYPFTVASVNGYVVAAPSGTVWVSGADQTIPVSFSLKAGYYGVDFTESGLATGTLWGVDLNGSLGTSTSTTIGFVAPHGSFGYVVEAVSGYAATPSSGTAVVGAANQTIAVTFQAEPGLFAVVFSETGLPTGTGWTVDLGGSLRGSSSGAITFSEPNGTYPFGVGAVNGFNESPATGSVSVRGQTVAIALTFQSVTLSVPLLFREEGLPTGTNWSVTVSASTGGLSIDSALTITRWSNGADSVVFAVSDGTFYYSAGANGFQTATGVVNVSGRSSAPVRVSLLPVTQGPRPNPAEGALPAWAAGIGIILAAIAGLGLVGSALRYRARERARGRLLVAGLARGEWAMEIDPEDPRDR